MSESAQKPKLRLDINLLHPKEIPPKLPERFLKWLITYGRFIVIAVEVIVVVSFVARFKYDADLDELKRKINLDLPYVEGLSADEALIKQTQLRIQTIGQGYNQTPDWQNIFTKISSHMPSSVKITNLLFEKIPNTPGKINIKLTGITTSNTDLAILLNNLRADKTFKDINLSNIIFDRDQIAFTLTGGTQ